MTSATNTALFGIAKRAEGQDRETLVRTFVDAGPLLKILSTRDHQVLFGRRGTGKTHALLYLSDQALGKSEPSAYVDMRVIGSNGSIYSDPKLPLPERGTRLLLDTLASVHDTLVDYALEHNSDSSVLAQLDALATAITQVEVVGEIEEEELAEESEDTKASAKLEAGLSGAKPTAKATLGEEERAVHKSAHKTTRKGIERAHVNFGTVSSALLKLVDAFPSKKAWILIDEWSVVPSDLQPLLADLVRRAILPVKGVTVKIAAIEQRTHFRDQLDAGGYVGIELGADVSAAMSLDDFMVFGNDQEKAESFFASLLHKHVVAVLEADGHKFHGFSQPDTFLQAAFTQMNVFSELVRASEGVPRDAINIVAQAAMKADTEKISMNIIRRAARTWYERDKDTSLPKRARKLLHWVIDKVLGERRTRAFLLEQGSGAKHSLISQLFDLRVLHLLRRDISAKDRPGVRFDVYGIDFGCYVNLIATAREPQGLLLPGDSPKEYEDVPTDDYRSIRRAILDLDAFEAAETDIDGN